MSIERNYNTYEELLSLIKKSGKNYDLEILEKAYKYACKAHKNQKRVSGIDYIFHPVSVAYILVELGMDTPTVAAALLHDVIEDTEITKDDIVLVLNNGFETLTDGRRPDGQPDYTQYVSNAGEVVTAHRLLPEVRFEISVDACDATVSGASGLKVGDNLIPANGKDVLVYSAKGTTVTAKNYLTIEAIKYFRLGGQFGGDFAKTLVVRAKQTV